MSKNIFSQFFCGLAAVFSGIKSFYRDPASWKYALYPVILLVFFYAAAIWLLIAAVTFCIHWCRNFAETLPEYLAWSEHIAVFFLVIAGTFFAIFAIITTLSSLYEIAGGFFFDHLASFWEKKYFNFQKSNENWKESLIFSWDSIIFSLGTVWYLLLLSAAGLLFPVISPIILTCVMGYRFGISALSCTAFNHGMRIRALRNMPGTFWKFMGFGLTAYLLIIIPFFGIFALPGIIIGGVELFYKLSNDRKC